jgi:hypothetical protein
MRPFTAPLLSVLATLSVIHQATASPLVQRDGVYIFLFNVVTIVHDMPIRYPLCIHCTCFVLGGWEGVIRNID